MAAYATQSDLVERFGARELAELTDETASQTPDAAEITKALDEASSLIDGYVAAFGYATPLNPVPTMVRGWCCALARKYLWKDRAGPESVVSLNAEVALGQLKDVAKGVIALPSASGVTPPATAGVAYSTPSTVFDTTGLL